VAVHGTISEFSNTQETWTSYIERLEQYLAANKVEDADQQRAILLSICGPATYWLICNFVSPNKPTELKLIHTQSSYRLAIIVEESTNQETVITKL